MSLDKKCKTKPYVAMWRRGEAQWQDSEPGHVRHSLKAKPTNTDGQTYQHRPTTYQHRPEPALPNLYHPTKNDCEISHLRSNPPTHSHGKQRAQSVPQFLESETRVLAAEPCSPVSHNFPIHLTLLPTLTIRSLSPSALPTWRRCRRARRHAEPTNTDGKGGLTALLASMRDCSLA